MIDQERTTPYNIIISRWQAMQLKKKINLGINYKWLIQYQILQTKLTSWEFLLTNNIIINNIKETSDENKEKYQQGNKLLIIDPIPNSPNQTNIIRIARQAVRRITKTWSQGLMSSCLRYFQFLSHHIFLWIERSN